MRLETFFEKFDLFAESPDAVVRMRELALRLAFSGALSGDQRDENGTPKGWELRTIASLCTSITPGFACSRSHQSTDGHVHLRTHNVSTLGTLNFDLLVRINPRKVDPQKASIRQGDILFNNTNSQNLVGKTCLVDRDYDYGFSNHITRLRLKDGVFPGFVVFYLTFLRNTGYFSNLCTRWINQAAVNTETLKKLTIPLPSLAEQKHIVAKVDELMALCDRLAAQQQERETRHAALARAALARFTGAPTPANLDFLFHPSYAITPADLRKTILTLAVQGQLVPQEPNDGDARAMIDRAMEKRQQAIRTKNLRRKELDESVGLFEHADLPSSWCVERFANLVDPENTISYGVLVPGNDVPDGIPFVRAQDLCLSNHPARPNKTIAPEVERPYARTRLAGGEILLCVVGSIGKLGIVPDSWAGANIARAVARIKPIPDVLRDYLLLVLQEQSVQNYFTSTTRTLAQPTLNVGMIEQTPIPVPPLAEQRRIVAKVDQLMALVDQLEAQLAEAQTKAAALYEAAIHELLNPSAEVVDLARYRAAIGCYAMQKMQGKPYFGRTAAMKALYLAEAHVGLALDLKPLREAAGPLDTWIYDFEREGERHAWFTFSEKTTSSGAKKIEYQAGKALAEQAEEAELLFSGGQRAEFDRLLALFSDRTTEQMELIATLFAAWNDFLIDGHAPTDDEIVTEVRENWHDSKRRFGRDQLQQSLRWLRTHGLVPQGRAPHTIHQPQLRLH